VLLLRAGPISCGFVENGRDAVIYISEARKSGRSRSSEKRREISAGFEEILAPELPKTLQISEILPRSINP